jgi:RND superfamily putative drug exporter
MQRLMLRLDDLVRRRRRLVLAAWLVALVAALPLAARQSDHLTGGGFNVPGSQSDRVEHALGRDFDRAQASTLGAVLVPRRDADPAQMRAAVDALGRAAGPVDHVVLTPAARRAALAEVERGGTRPVIVPLSVDVPETQAPDVATDLRDRLGLSDGGGPSGPVATHLIGQGALWAGLQDVTKSDLASAEATGLPIVALILLAVFGSLAAAALPLGLGAISVTITGALIYLLSRQIEMSVFVSNMASMIGIGVAVDYSLFVLARYREEVRGGADFATARARAMSTSGVAVVFSGMTVVLSLAGLWLIDSTALRSMALGAILVVAVSVLAAATLLPALLSLLGRRASALGRLGHAARAVAGRVRPRRRAPAPDRPGFWARWSERVMRRPVVSVVAAASVLLALAAPAIAFHTDNGALRQFPPGDETRQGFEAAARVTGPGAASPVQVVVPRADAAATVRVARADGEVARVAAPVVSKDGRHTLVTIVPGHDGESDAAKALVTRLRAELPAGAAVGGASAGGLDYSDLVSGSMWKIALFVLGLSYIVLFALLRSVILPLKAVVMNLLSVGAAYGVLVAVFQWGWADAVLGTNVETGSIQTITPPLVLAVVFGLSMDYEVFLLSRIRERYNATGDTRCAVAEGLSTSARTITSAALIMVAVFAVFVSTGVPSIKEIGLGCAVAIAVDATIVRLVLVPAAMELLGRWNWWVPAPLARILPARGLEEAVA